MKHRLGNKLNTAVELTSLLDVIFIILMIVICNQQINLEEKRENVEKMAVEAQTEAENIRLEADAVRAQAEAELMAAEDLKAEVQAEKELFEKHRDRLENITEQMTTVTVRIDFQPSNPKTRTIRMSVDGRTEEPITVTPATEDDAFSKFEETLENTVAEAEAENKPVVIEIDMDGILYRDEQRTEEMLFGISGRHQNLFYRK